MENYIIDFIIHSLPHFQHPFLTILQQDCFCQGTRRMTSVNVSCGVINSIFPWHITFTIPHFTPMRKITFFISFMKRNVHWDAFFIWFLSACSPITTLADYFSISYLSIFIKAPATLCIALPLYSLFYILPGKPPGEHRETLCLGEVFHTVLTGKITSCMYYISASRDLIKLGNPAYVFVSMNSLLKDLFLEMFQMGWEKFSNKLQ